MKRFVLYLIMTFVIVNNIPAQIRDACYFDNTWSEWLPEPTKRVTGDFNQFSVYEEADGPSGYFFKVKIDDFKVTPKKQRKKDLKKNEIVKYEFTGTVEYFLPDYGGFPNTTIYDLFKYAKKPFLWPNVKKDKTMPDVKKVVSRAKIKIYNYEKFPQYYAIYFDNVGLGFYLDEDYFANTVFNFEK